MKIKLYPKFLIRRLLAKGKSSFYSAGYKLLYPECTRNGMTPWQHYVIDGRRKGYDDGNHPSDSVFFRGGYEAEYPDVRASGDDVWHHYAESGAAEGRDNGLHPKEDLFFAEGYREMYPDVAESGLDPWHHYVLIGKKEGRDNGLHPSKEMFFPEGYLEMYQDVGKNGIDPWHHYVLYGKREGRDNGGHPKEDQFFREGYLEMYPDVAESGTDPWHHYVLHGKGENRDNGLHPKSDQFCAEGYFLNYPDVKNAGENAWRHYILYGKKIWQEHCLEDYRIRLDGHEDEIIRTIYMAKADGNKKRKILLIGHEFSVSGAPLSLLGLAKILISDGYHVDIAVRGKVQISPVHLYDGIGADVFMIPYSNEAFPGAENILRGYDLVIINTVVMGAYASACKKLNVPHLWFIREDLPTIRYNFYLDVTCRQYFFDDCENILCVSKYVSDCLYSAYKIKSRYINNFIEDVCPSVNGSDKAAQRWSGKVRSFAVVGNIQDRKAQQTAAASFLCISGNSIYKGRWKLFFIGEFSKDSRGFCLGDKLAAATKNVPDIVWCGEVTEKKWEFFKSIDFFIVPSLEEASSRVAIEAAMLGKPVICTTHVGAKYLTENGAGFIFEPGDISALRDIVVKCIDMPETEYRKMSRQVRLNYENSSSPEVYRKSLSAIIDETLVRFNSKFLPAEKDEFAVTSFRKLSNGKNVFFYNKSDKIRFLYIDFADFSGADAPRSLPVSHANGCRQEVAIVIPVFNGTEQLKFLIPSIFKNTSMPHKFIFVDDCSGEEIANLLNRTVSGRDDCILIRNEKRLGLVKSSNIGAEKALEICGNFILLDGNADVPTGWLGQLIQTFLENENVSSAVPFSNRCDMFSFPFIDQSERNEAFLTEFGLEGINSAMRKSCCMAYISVPAAHGFCMAFSGKVWRKIGGLNDALFESLYDAQKEWSLRALIDGYRSILASNLYVVCRGNIASSHEQGDGKNSSVQDILSVMFPSYDALVHDFTMEYPLSGSVVSIYLSLARQKGYKAEVFTEFSPFMTRMSGSDGIFVLRTKNITKLAVRLLGETVLVGNARNVDRTGVFDA